MVAAQVRALPEFAALAAAVEVYTLQRQQAEADLVQLAAARERYLRDPQRFLDDLANGVLRTLPRPQHVAPLPSLNDTQYAAALFARGIVGALPVAVAAADDVAACVDAFPTTGDDLIRFRNALLPPASDSTRNQYQLSQRAPSRATSRQGSASPLASPLASPSRAPSSLATSSITSSPPPTPPPHRGIALMTTPAATTHPLAVSSASTGAITSNTAVNVPLPGAPRSQPNKPRRVTKPRVSGTFYINATGSINENMLMNTQGQGLNKKNAIPSSTSSATSSATSTSQGIIANQVSAQTKRKRAARSASTATNVHRSAARRALAAAASGTGLGSTDAFAAGVAQAAPSLQDTAEFKELEALRRAQEATLAMHRVTSVVHRGFSCDGCGADPIVGTRWTCKACHGIKRDFDLCDDCSTRANSDPSTFTCTASRGGPHVLVKAPDPPPETESLATPGAELAYLGL